MQEDRLLPGARRGARQRRAISYSADELRALLTQVRGGDLPTRDRLFDYFHPHLASMDAFFRRAHPVVDDVYGEGYLILMRLFAELVIEPAVDPRAAILAALRRDLKAYARRHYTVAYREVLWTALSPEAPAEELAAAMDGKQHDLPSLGDLLHRPLPEHLEGEAVCRVTLQQALVRLPDDARTVVLLHVQEGRDFEEIGDATQAQEATCRKRYERARGRLRRDLEESFAGA